MNLSLRFHGTQDSEPSVGQIRTKIKHDSDVLRPLIRTKKILQIDFGLAKRVKIFHVIIPIVEYVMTDERVPESYVINVYLDYFTTCWDLLKLYDILDQLQNRVCYDDIDSVIYIAKKGESNLPRGDYLGDLKASYRVATVYVPSSAEALKITLMECSPANTCVRSGVSLSTTPTVA